ncbi:MAG: hypothetical protein P8H56_11430 [Crocinitomicaceae bacterium]|nr:hypothetical protein [Crocinitomicaceae bacterium]MDG1659186.1 hypothetical protein [Crocinitomicaceae bacterium]
MKQYFSFSVWGSEQWLIILLFFMISVLARWPNLDRPLSKHHEFVTSISLRVLQSWEENGIAETHFSPGMNYGARENKFIDNHATSLGNMHDDKGNFYYISHPPFAYLLPYACFQMVGAKASVLNLQIFHLLINLLSVIFIVLIVRKIDTDPKVALFSGIIYLFLPATLWFQSNTYMSDMLVHVFFLIGILLFLKLKDSTSLLLSALFLLNLCVMTYTSWLGVFFTCIVCCWAIFKMSGAIRFTIILTSVVGCASALGITYIQYGSIAGYDVFLDQLFDRLALRGSNSSDNSGGVIVSKTKEIGYLIFNYAVHYWYLFLLVLSAIIMGRRKKLPNFLDKHKSFILVSTLPIIVLHLALLNYSTHDFTVLYSSAFFSIIGAVSLLYIFKKKQTGYLMIVIALGCIHYYVINLPGETSIKGIKYSESMDLGQTIASQLETEEVGFILEEKLDPMVIHYAHRNIKTVQSEGEAEIWLNDFNCLRGRLFYYKGGVLHSKQIQSQHGN